MRYYFDKWTADRTFQRLNDAHRVQVRVQAGRDPEPSAAILDSQTAKATEVGGERGYDGGKKTWGRMRHILVDTMGNLLGINVHPAEIADRDGARLLLEEAGALFPRLQQLWADQGYTGLVLDWIRDRLGWTVQIVRKLAGQVGFIPLPRRWVVERSFAWSGRYRRLAKHYDFWRCRASRPCSTPTAAINEPRCTSTKCSTAHAT